MSKSRKGFVVYDDEILLPYDQCGNFNLQFDATDVGDRMGAPERNVYPRDASVFWNGHNQQHCCNECRCLLCTAMRWVVLPHCNCKLPRISMGLPLDARLRRKRMICRHFPRHSSTPL
ncbi:hypothetical protein KC19_VG234300 [Ceratodon purpureus]|uniref:Uncharacterized protein n=1 Tax=Ceratodon purpureus TaxID=3225 RepID=A0A8T0HSY4_CERPU|nr:hypothetical protein KC19_VG234300 [Ceratodon purpureus]